MTASSLAPLKILLSVSVLALCIVLFAGCETANEEERPVRIPKVPPSTRSQDGTPSANSPMDSKGGVNKPPRK